MKRMKLVKDVAILDGKWQISDGKAVEVDDVTRMGTIVTRTRLPREADAKLFHVEQSAEMRHGKLVAFEKYHYFGHIEIVQVDVKPEDMR